MSELNLIYIPYLAQIIMEFKLWNLFHSVLRFVFADAPSTSDGVPDANEMRRRRLAKLATSLGDQEQKNEDS